MMRALNRLAPNLIALKCWLLSIRVLWLVGLCGLSPALWAADIAKGVGAYGIGQLQLYGYAVDSAGNRYTAGYMTGRVMLSNSLVLTPIGSADLVVIKYNSSFTPVWAKNFGGANASAIAAGLALDSSGNVYVAGRLLDGDMTTPAVSKIGSQDALVIKLDSSGNVTWAKNFGGSGATALAEGVAVDGSGNVYLGGSFLNASLTTPALTKIGTRDAFAFKLDSSGNTTWAKNYGGSGGTALGTSIAVDGSGNSYLGGYFSGANLTTPAVTKIGSRDAFAFKLDSSGNTTWSKNYGGSGALADTQGIAVDGSGNVYLGGGFSGANLTTPALTLIGGNDAFAFKLDSSGNTTWSKNFGGSSASISASAAAVAVDSSGNVYLNGQFASGNLTTPALSVIGNFDGFAFKLDSSGNTTWAKGFGGSGASVTLKGLAVDGSGNVHLAGFFQSASLTTPAVTKIGFADSLLLQLDSSGNTTATNSSPAYVPSSTMQFNGVAQDSSGNIYVAGTLSTAFAIFENTVLTRVGTSTDAVAAKFNSNGDLVWAKSFGGGGSSTQGLGIAVDSSGNVYLAGNFNVNLTTPALTKIGSQDAFAIKLDSSGNTTWAKNFGGSGASVQGRSIAVDSSGNVYLGGDFTSANLTTPALTKIGSRDAFAIKLDSSGTTTWAKNFGGSSANAFGRGIAVDSSGNVYVGGNFTSANLTTPALTQIGTGDAFAFKLDSSGTTTWAKNFGGSGATTSGQSVVVDSSGNVYLGGDLISANLTTPELTKIGTRDAFAFKLDSSGTTTWAKNFGGSGNTTFGQGIAVDSNGNVYLGGYFQSANLTTPALTLVGTSDAYAIKLDSSGNTVLTKQFGGSGSSTQALSIAVDSNANAVIAGRYSAALTTTPTLSGLGGTAGLFARVDMFSVSVPGAPTIGTATAGIASATVAFTAPASNGGAAITGYTATSSPGGFTSTGCTASPCTVTGLTNGTAYTFTVTATNGVGTGNPSAPSNSVTPFAPFVPPVVVVQPLVVSVPTDKPQTQVSSASTVLADVPAGTRVSDNGVVVLPSTPSGSINVTLKTDATGDAIVQLPANTPVTVNLGTQSVVIKPAPPVLDQRGEPAASQPPVQVQTKTVTITDEKGNNKTVTGLQVVQGSALLTASNGEPLAAFGGTTASGCSKNTGYILPLTTDTTVQQSAVDSAFLLLGHIRQGVVQVFFSACASGANGNVFAAAQSVKVFRGEQLYLDKSAQLDRVVVRSATGIAGDAGDPLTLSTLPGLSFVGSAFVPQLAKDTGRLPIGTTLQSRLADVALAQFPTLQGGGWQFKGQDSLGTVRFTRTDQEVVFAPFGEVRIEPGSADSVRVGSTSQGVIIANETRMVVNAMPRDSARLVADIRKLDAQANVQVVDDGTLRISFRGHLIATQPNWNVVYGSQYLTLPAFEADTVDERGACHYADGWRQCYYPIVNDFATLNRLATQLGGTVVADRKGVVKLSVKGQTYDLLPDWQLILTPAAHAKDDYWVDGGHLFVRNPNGYSQGFAVK